MANILLYGGGLQVLSIARSLKECNHKVHVANDDNTLARCCRYVDCCKNVLCSDTQLLMSCVQSWSIDVIIPMEDKWAETLSVNKQLLESKYSVKCAIADYDIYSLASDKSKLLKFCKEYNFPHPRTCTINRDFNYAAEYVGFPALIKPNHSAGSRGIRLVNNIVELKTIAEQVEKEYGECSLQEYIQNDYYYNVMLYRTKDGIWANHTITKIIRYYPIKGGSSSFCYSIENEKLLNTCKRILEELKWVGFADFDVLEKGDGDYRVIEINPRVPASVKAAAISGVNFGEIIVKDALGLDIPTYKYKTNMQLRYLGLDIAWFLSSPNRFKCIPSWFKFFGRNLYYQEGGFNDIFAMIASLFSGVKKIISPSFRKSKSGMN